MKLLRGIFSAFRIFLLSFADSQRHREIIYFHMRTLLNACPSGYQFPHEQLVIVFNKGPFLSIFNLIQIGFQRKLSFPFPLE